MEFKKYTSIENAYRQKAVDAIQNYFSDEIFVVQEKIHGANFAFYVDADGIKMAKRSGFLAEGENFYNSDIILKRYEDNLNNLFKKLKIALDVDFESFSVHGEIYGGSYPHKDVDKVQNITKVQNKCFYSPDAEFTAFDMKINGKIIDIGLMNSYLDKVGVPRSYLLRQGTFQECLEYPNDEPCQMPIERGYPALEDNISEGTVIKPMRPLYDHRGNRVILKNKNPKFSEKKNKPVKIKAELEPHVKEFVEIALSYVTENRLRNVLSKIGTITEMKKAFPLTMKPFTADIIEEFMKENESFLELEKSEKKEVTSAIAREAGNMIRANLGNIVDGEF